MYIYNKTDLLSWLGWQHFSESCSESSYQIMRTIRIPVITGNLKKEEVKATVKDTIHTCILSVVLYLLKQLQEHYPGCQRFSKRGAAKRQLAKRQGQKREGEKRWGSLWLSATVDLNHTWHQYIWTRSDPVSWLEESYRLVYSDWLLLTDRCVVTGCLLINLMILYNEICITSNQKLSLDTSFISCLTVAKENVWDHRPWVREHRPCPKQALGLRCSGQAWEPEPGGSNLQVAGCRLKIETKKWEKEKQNIYNQ